MAEASAVTRNASIADFSPVYQRQIAEKLGQQKTVVRAPLPLPANLEYQSKFGNRRTAYKSVQGFERAYDSALEARTAAMYDLGINTGLIKAWLPQVPFLLPGGVRYVADFLVLWADGRVAFVDAKGRDTQASINKRKQVLALYGIEIELVRAA
jgi:hypothetical protein